MPYNTGNPVGSRSPKDLLDNSENLDELVNSPTKETHPDRLGVDRKTWHGMETDFQQFMDDSAYQPLGDYDTDGPFSVEYRSQVFLKDGEYYRIAADAGLPYTTTDWVTDEPNFVGVGDAVLRQDLGSEGGVRLVRGAVAEIGNVTGLRVLEEVLDDQVVVVKNDPGGLDGAFVAETSVAADDGVDVFESVNGKRFRRAKIAASNGRVALEIPGSASKSHLLLRNVAAGPTRMHVEPNGHVDSGTITKQDWMFDPYNDDQANYRIINIYTKQGQGSGYNGQNGVAVLGAKGVGDHFGIFPSINVGFSDDNANGVPLKVMYFDTSDTAWRTPLLGAWREGRAVSLGDYILANFKLYRADGAGTTGATKPSHSSGTASDGGVSWTFVRDYQAASGSIKPCVVIGDRDDMPKFGFPNARAQFAGSAVVWNGEKFQFLDGDGSAAWEIGADLFTDDFFIRSLTGGGSLRFGADGSFVQNTGLAYLLSSLTENSESGVVAVGKTEMLSLNNANPTNITQFTGLPYQRFYVEASNSNTTLVHGTNLKLAGGVNRVVTGDDTLQFVLNASGTTAKQVVS